jgi:hypothetical protein
MFELRRYQKLLLVLAALGFALLACNMPGLNGSAATPTAGALSTEAQQTVAAELTRIFSLPTITTVAGASATPAATQTWGSPSPTVILVSPSPWPSATPYPTFVPPSATYVPLPPPPPTYPPTPVTLCNQALFIKDVTIPDWTQMSPGQTFTKVWRLKNTGACTWTSAYSLVYVGGAELGKKSTPLLVTVAPGQEMDLAVDLVAPATAGSYQSYWMLRSPQGANFGIGAGAATAFWVAIKVVQPQPQWQTYTNSTFKITLKFPANWTRTEGDPASGERFGAADGYVQLSAANAMNIDALAQTEANQPSQPYGPNPRIETMTVQGQPARLITPSTLAAPGVIQNAALIVLYPRPALVMNTFYNYLVLYADAGHVRDIAANLVFTAVGPYPPSSQSPAAGVCSEPPAGTFVVFNIRVDMPDPRCGKVRINQQAQFVNQTGNSLRLRLADYEFTLQPGETYSFAIPFGSFMSYGVYNVQMLSGMGVAPEIWLTP